MGGGGDKIPGKYVCHPLPLLRPGALFIDNLGADHEHQVPWLVG